MFDLRDSFRGDASHGSRKGTGRMFRRRRALEAPLSRVVRFLLTILRIAR